MSKEQMEKRIVELEQQLAQERAKTPTIINFPPAPALPEPLPTWYRARPMWEIPRDYATQPLTPSGINTSTYNFDYDFERVAAVSGHRDLPYSGDDNL